MKLQTVRLFYTPCNAHQAGALHYTNRLYAKEDPDRVKPKWLRWLNIRDRWMTQQEELHGDKNLTCAICGKTGLNPWGKQNKPASATIDHILPVSKFPHLQYVESNFQVACSTCNRKKADKIH